MAIGIRRFTISISPNLEAELDKVKQEIYSKDTHLDMIRDLIMRGLESYKAKKSKGEV